MLEIAAFKALRYSEENVKSFNKVVAPPYDVISSKQQNALYKKSRYNIVRLILGKTYPADNAKNNRYKRASGFLLKWIDSGILIEEKRPAIYVYRQRYKDIATGRAVQRLGFIARFKLQAFSRKNIFPHEHTLSKPKEDRLKLIKATGCNYSPVFCLYHEKEDKIGSVLKRYLRRKPLVSCTDEDKTEHKIYAIYNENDINTIAKILKNKKAFIADGHHRYETALAYRDYLKSKKQPLSDAAYTMMYFTNLESEGLRIYPIHRLVENIKPELTDKLFKELRKYFEVSEAGGKTRLLEAVQNQQPGNYCFGMYTGDKFYMLKPQKGITAEKLYSKKSLTQVEKLGVSLLQNIIINKILGISSEDVKYIRDEAEIIRQVRSRRDKLGFFVPAVAKEEIIRAATRGERLPRKSTYFYPKLYSGLVVNRASR